MYSQAPYDKLTPEQSYTVGNLIRKQLEKVDLGEVADYFQSLKDSAVVNADESPSITTNRRRARPFTEMESVVVEDDEANANALLALTRTLDAETAATARENSELYKLLLQSRMQ